MNGRSNGLFSVLTAFMFVLALLGCQNAVLDDKKPEAAGKENAGPKNQTMINFWFSFGGDFQRDFQKYIIDEFEKANPDIKVKMTFAEETGKTHVSDKLLTAIAAGNAPDVATFDRFAIGSWAAKGALEDISDLIKRDGIRQDDYYRGVWEETVYKGRVYALPFLVDTRAMYYNKTLLEKAGFDPEKPPQTIDELDRMAEKLFVKNKNGKYEQVGFLPWMGQGSLFTHGINFGASFVNKGEFDPTEPQVVKALEWMTGYAQKYDISTLTGFSNAVAQTGLEPFWTGRVGFVFHGNWILSGAPQYKPDFEWGVAPMPSATGSPSMSWVGGNAFVIPKGAKNREAAWRFVKFVAHKEGNLLWAGRPNGRGLITSMPAVNAQLKLYEDAKLRVFLDLLATARTRPVSPVASFYWAEMYRIRDLALNGKGSPAALLKEAKKNTDAELQKLYERRY
ncbi:ABC transporter substrate-binding protein [Paenibacillus thalictri]|uniref:ABC transporter substrate-binding protein n=1 Tax=Paenibacillus thalictri TaxID=2527873 RepID=A0A4Q9DLM7_9BACL|nr:ABC transporter substrate-binding protein [Paenibacillus thalictri]TBL73892.1 ABC transporter substrate-binding protein [Paenibacillus thalictri]